MAEIRISGAIGEFSEEGSVNTKIDLDAAIANIADTEEIIVKINSPGGSVFEGMGMYNSLKSAPNPITTVNEGLAASIASLILLAGDKGKVKMSSVGLFMAHFASTVVMGNSEDLEKQADSLKGVDQTLINVYQERTGLSEDEIRGLMDQEKFLTAEEALEKGFIDEIVNTVDAKMAAQLITNKEKTVNLLKDAFRKITNQSEEEAAEVVEESTVKEETSEEVQETETVEEKVQEIASYSKEEIDAKFNEMLTVLNEIKEKVNASPSRDEVAEAVTEHTKATMSELKTGLKSTNTVLEAANNSLTKDENTWVEKHSKHRQEMAEIDAKTRIN